MKTKTERILTVMNVLSWIVFIGLLIQGGAILISYFVSLFNLQGAKDLYLGLNLFSLRESNIWHYTAVVSFMITLLGLKAYTAFLVIKILSKISLTNPFNIEIAMLIEKVSYIILETWIVAMVANAYNDWLSKSGLDLQGNSNSVEFIFLAGVIYIIAQIFKKGIEIQSENELTI